MAKVRTPPASTALAAQQRAQLQQVELPTISAEQRQASKDIHSEVRGPAAPSVPVLRAAEVEKRTGLEEKGAVLGNFAEAQAAVESSAPQRSGLLNFLVDKRAEPQVPMAAAASDNTGVAVDTENLEVRVGRPGLEFEPLADAAPREQAVDIAAEAVDVAWGSAGIGGVVVEGVSKVARKKGASAAAERIGKIGGSLGKAADGLNIVSNASTLFDSEADLGEKAGAAGNIVSSAKSFADDAVKLGGKIADSRIGRKLAGEGLEKAGKAGLKAAKVAAKVPGFGIVADVVVTGAEVYDAVKTCRDPNKPWFKKAWSVVHVATTAVGFIPGVGDAISIVGDVADLWIDSLPDKGEGGKK